MVVTQPAWADAMELALGRWQCQPVRARRSHLCQNAAPVCTGRPAHLTSPWQARLPGTDDIFLTAAHAACHRHLALMPYDLIHCLQLAQGRRGVEALADPRRALAGGRRHRGRLRLRLPEG